jgi:transposase InsO family protein
MIPLSQLFKGVNVFPPTEFASPSLGFSVMILYKNITERRISMDEIQQEKVALFRFGVIGSLISGELIHGELNTRIREICMRRYSIPYSERTTIAFGTIEEWYYKYCHFGFEGLKPVSRSEKGKLKHIRPELKDTLIRMKQEHPKMSAKTMMRKLVSEGKMKPSEISKNTVYRLFKKELSCPSGTKKEQKRFVHRFPNDCWQADVMYGPYIKDELSQKAKRTYLVAFLDDTSRLIVGARFFFSESVAHIKTVLKHAVLTYGVPAKLYVDNGRNFCSDDIRIACASMHTALIHCTPYFAQGKGKIERFFRTVRSCCLSCLDHVNSLEELNNRFDQWLQNEYNRGKHSALDNESPLTAFLKKIEGRMRRMPKHINSEELFFRKETRLVAKDATFRLNNMLYETQEQYIGKKISVLFDRDDQRQMVKVYDGPCFIHTATPIDYFANAKYKRKDKRC